jgi:hypothetical protein
MVRWILAGFLVAHGLVHITVWASAKTADAQGTHPEHSWLLGEQHSAVVALTYAAVGLFALAGGALILQFELWRWITVVASGVSLLLVALFPAAILGPWIVAPLAIDIGLMVSILSFAWPSKTMVGV